MKTLAGICCLLLLSVTARGQSDTTFNFRRAWQPRQRPWAFNVQRLCPPDADGLLSYRQMASAVYQGGLSRFGLNIGNFPTLPSGFKRPLPYPQLMGHPYSQPSYRLNGLNRWLIR